MPLATRDWMHHNRELVKSTSSPLVWWNFNLDWPFLKFVTTVGCCLVEGTLTRVWRELKVMHWLPYECWGEKVDRFDVSSFLTAVQKCIFVCDVCAPAKSLVAKVDRARDLHFAVDTDAASTHLESLDNFMKLFISNKQYLVKGKGNICNRIGPSCVTASIRTNAGAYFIFLQASSGAVVFLDNCKTSFLHCLVVLFRDGKVFSLGDGLAIAFSFLHRHQGLSLAVGDPSLPGLHHVVSGRLWNAPTKGKTLNLFFAEILWCFRDLTGGVRVEQHFAFWHKVHRFSVVAMRGDLYLWGRKA